MEIAQTPETTGLLSSILVELRKQRTMNDELWSIDEIADYMKLSKKSLHNSKIVEDKTFPRNIILPTGGRRWLAKEIREWIKRRRS